MNDEKLVTFNNLKYYDSKLRTYITNEGTKKSPINHSHALYELETDPSHTITTQVDIDRTAGFRKCLQKNYAQGIVQINTNIYDMVYLELSEPVTIELLDINFDPAEDLNRGSKARHIKIIIKNPSAGITWPDNVVWIDENNPPTYTSGNDKVDVVDLFTPDGTVWFANIMKSWTLN